MKAVVSRRGLLTRAGVLAALALFGPAAAHAQATAPQCRPASALTRIDELPEASGLAASRTAPGRLWSHNDSGQPALFALTADGRVAGRVTVSGARVEDWEAIAVGPCPGGFCIYVADIGDNEAERKQITIYRMAEPASTGVVQAEAFHAAYPDGAHDAESLLVTADGRLFVVTKGDTGAVALYRFPAELRPNTTMRLERVGKPRETGTPPADDRITDGTVSPDGRWIVLRSNGALSFYRATDLLAGHWRKAGEVSLRALAEPQGEGVAFAADGALFVSGEGGGKKQPGTLARLTCTMH